MTDRVHTIALLRRGDEILLAMKKRGFGTGKWNGAGGKVEPGETVEQGMIRECQEELSVTPTAYEKVAYIDFILAADTHHPWHQYAHIYIVTEWTGEPVETEEMSPLWFHKTYIPYADMWDDDAHWLPLVLAGKRITGRFTFDSSEHTMTKEVQEVEAFDDETVRSI